MKWVMPGWISSALIVLAVLNLVLVVVLAVDYRLIWRSLREKGQPARQSLKRTATLLSIAAIGLMLLACYFELHNLSTRQFFVGQIAYAAGGDAATDLTNRLRRMSLALSRNASVGCVGVKPVFVRDSIYISMDQGLTSAVLVKLGAEGATSEQREYSFEFGGVHDENANAPGVQCSGSLEIAQVSLGGSVLLYSKTFPLTSTPRVSIKERELRDNWYQYQVQVRLSEKEFSPSENGQVALLIRHRVEPSSGAMPYRIVGVYPRSYGADSIENWAGVLALDFPLREEGSRLFSIGSNGEYVIESGEETAKWFAKGAKPVGGVVKERFYYDIGRGTALAAPKVLLFQQSRIGERPARELLGVIMASLRKS